MFKTLQRFFRNLGYWFTNSAFQHVIEREGYIKRVHWNIDQQGRCLVHVTIEPTAKAPADK